MLYSFGFNRRLPFEVVSCAPDGSTQPPRSNHRGIEIRHAHPHLIPVEAEVYRMGFDFVDKEEFRQRTDASDTNTAPSPAEYEEAAEVIRGALRTLGLKRHRSELPRTRFLSPSKGVLGIYLTREGCPVTGGSRDRTPNDIKHRRRTRPLGGSTKGVGQIGARQPRS